MGSNPVTDMDVCSRRTTHTLSHHSQALHDVTVSTDLQFSSLDKTNYQTAISPRYYNLMVSLSRPQELANRLKKLFKDIFY